MRNEVKGNTPVDTKNNDDNKQGDVGDDVNIKRSIEMKNGVALRSMNNFHKGTNAISLNNYKVSQATIFDLIVIKYECYLGKLRRPVVHLRLNLHARPLDPSLQPDARLHLRR